MTRALGLVLAILLAGCAQGVSVDAVETRPDVVLTSVNVPAGMLEDAAARWATATGLDIRVGAGGVPVEVVPQAYMFGDPVCGVTATNVVTGPRYVQVSTEPPAGKCRSTADVLTHEVAHVIAWTFAPTAPAGSVHTHSAGLMTVGYETAIDGDALAALCALAPCSVMIPEAPER